MINRANVKFVVIAIATGLRLTKSPWLDEMSSQSALTKTTMINRGLSITSRTFELRHQKREYQWIELEASAQSKPRNWSIPWGGQNQGEQMKRPKKTKGIRQLGHQGHQISPWSYHSHKSRSNIPESWRPGLLFQRLPSISHHPRRRTPWSRRCRRRSSFGKYGKRRWEGSFMDGYQPTWGDLNTRECGAQARNLAMLWRLQIPSLPLWGKNSTEIFNSAHIYVRTGNNGNSLADLKRQFLPSLDHGSFLVHKWDHRKLQIMHRVTPIFCLTGHFSDRKHRTSRRRDSLSSNSSGRRRYNVLDGDSSNLAWSHSSFSARFSASQFGTISERQRQQCTTSWVQLWLWCTSNPQNPSISTTPSNLHREFQCLVSLQIWETLRSCTVHPVWERQSQYTHHQERSNGSGFM